MKTYIIGDIHGEYEKLVNCLKSVNFDYNNDTLIQLGDVVDRGVHSYECIEELLKIKNLIAIRGNHDDCFYQSVLNGKENLLFHQGGRETLQSYTRNLKIEKATQIPENHKEFFKNQFLYYIDKNNNCFVHAGFNPNFSILEQPELSDLYWDRNLWNTAYNFNRVIMIDKFNEIYIGHTPTTYYNSTIPLKRGNIWNLDTGCGKGGLLTLMNLETKEFKQF
jgi:serine/threonine protein phosphatase 1